MTNDELKAVCFFNRHSSLVFYLFQNEPRGFD